MGPGTTTRRVRCTTYCEGLFTSSASCTGSPGGSHPLRAPSRRRHWGRTAPADQPEPITQNQSSYQFPDVPRASLLNPSDRVPRSCTPFDSVQRNAVTSPRPTTTEPSNETPYADCPPSTSIVLGVGQRTAPAREFSPTMTDPSAEIANPVPGPDRTLPGPLHEIPAPPGRHRRPPRPDRPESTVLSEIPEDC